MKKITHITTVHSRFDTRIFHKMCLSAVSNGYSVTLIVADGMGSETNNRVLICDLGKPKNRISRIINKTKEAYELSIKCDSDIYHLHDPELMPIGLKLKNKGKCVIFDAHEDFPKQIMGKQYINLFLRNMLSYVFFIYEKWACKKFNAVIAATPYICNKFQEYGINCIDVNNYPLFGEYNNRKLNIKEKNNEICYVGSINKIRGIKEIIEAMNLVKNDLRLNICGLFDDNDFYTECRKTNGWRFVNELGYLDRKSVYDVMERSIAGLVTLYPQPNYKDALPVKMFEYMAAGIPVIASDFPLWKDIIEENKCGICVDPKNIYSIAGAINSLVADTTLSQKMGKNGREAVYKKYNWLNEEKKLFKLYSEVLNDY